jgi:hypothetical protein
MSRQASILSAIATLALSLGALAPTAAGTAHAAGACNAAPKPMAPAGSHWYYRTDRAAGRKCWYLAAEGSKGRIAAPRVATPDTDADAEPAAPPMAEVAARLTEPLLSPPPAAAVPAASTIVSQAAPSAPLQIPPADSAQRSDEPASAPIAQEPAARVAQEPAADQAPAAVAAPVASAAAAAAPAPARINAMQFVFVAFVGICFLAGLFFYLAAVRRRRMEIRIVDLNTRAPLRTPAMTAMTDSPSVAPDATARRHDGEIDDERLRRFSQAWKRQAA